MRANVTDGASCSFGGIAGGNESRLDPTGSGAAERSGAGSAAPLDGRLRPSLWNPKAERDSAAVTLAAPAAAVPWAMVIRPGRSSR